MSAAAHDEDVDMAALDGVFAAYGASERGFRKAFENSRRYRNLDRLMPPFVVKLGLETLALIHRRKGTWA